MQLGIKNLGPDGTLIAAGHLTTIKMQLINEPEQSIDHGKVKIWENGNFLGKATKDEAQKILDERAEKGYDDKINIV